MKGNKNVTEKQTTMKHIKTWNLKKRKYGIANEDRNRKRRRN